MKKKTLGLSALCFSLIVGRTSAATLFRVSVEGQADVLTTAPPIERGSVVLVRRASDGQLTSIPAELVRAVSAVPKTGAIKLTSPTNLATAKAGKTPKVTTTLAANSAAATLASGPPATTATTIVLGPTGGRTGTTLTPNTLVVSAARSAGPTLSVNPPGASIEAQIFRGDLPRLTPRGTELTVGGNAATAPTTPLNEIGPNGFPIFGGVTIPPLATVDTNGFLTTAPTAAGTPTVLPIAPNGFPDLSAAASAQTGLTQATTGQAATVPATTTSSRPMNAGVPARSGAAAPSASAPAARSAATASPR